MNSSKASKSSPAVSPEVVAWKRFCQRIEALGERILEDDFPNTRRDNVEGIAHLADQVSCWLGWSIPHADSTNPFFHRSNDLFTQWGGPNQDNAYHHARIDPKRRYRVAGKMNSCEHFVLTFRVGFMHMKEWGTKAAISSVDRGIESGDDFEILIGGDGSDPALFPIPEDVTTLSTREYYVDWQPAEPATMTIECLDEIESAPLPSGEHLASQLDHALDQVESSVFGWNAYMAEHRSKAVDNTFASQQTVAKGLSDARYAFLFWNLAPDEALIIETDRPNARYWGLQLANASDGFEQVDPIPPHHVDQSAPGPPKQRRPIPTCPCSHGSRRSELARQRGASRRAAHLPLVSGRRATPPQPHASFLSRACENRCRQIRPPSRPKSAELNSGRGSNISHGAFEPERLGQEAIAMNWTPPVRPDWVREINQGIPHASGATPHDAFGDLRRVRQEAVLPLTKDQLIADVFEARNESLPSGSEIENRFGHPDYPAQAAFENLERFLVSVRNECELHALGRFMTRRFLLRLLNVRIDIMDWLRRDPGVQDEELIKPIFVAGAPRTGTTILHTLLATDPRHRVPEGWELLHPVPPPSPDPEAFASDQRIQLANVELIRPQSVVSGLLSIHEYGGRKPKECLSAQSFAFQSEEFTARFSAPSYEGWLVQSDMRPAYQMHRLVLQILQRKRPGTAWVLKSPVHLHDLPSLFETYPDARVAITHRDPRSLLASLTSLIANLRWSHSDHVDPKATALAHVERYHRTFDRLVDWTESGLLPEAQIHHSYFADFQQAPIDTTSRLYERFGIELPDSIRDSIRQALAEHPASAHGGHSYSQDDLGEDPLRTRSRFERYQSYFDVPFED